MPKATLAPDDGSDPLEFQFNPKELSISKAATWNRPTNKGAKNASKPEFGGVQPQAVQMEIFFNDWEGDGHLVKDIEKLLEWLKPTDASINQKAKPQPRALQFHWGQGPLADFKG